MRSRNRVELMGHLGSDCQLKFTPTGKARTTFSVATSRRYKVGEEWKEETDWHQCVLWESEAVSAYLVKGAHVMIDGSLRTRKYEKEGQAHYITEVHVSEVNLLDKKPAADGPVSQPRGRAAAGSSTPPPNDDLGITDDDVPF